MENFSDIFNWIYKILKRESKDVKSAFTFHDMEHDFHPAQIMTSSQNAKVD